MNLDFTHGVAPTNASAITALEQVIARYRQGLMSGQECLWEIGDAMVAHADATKSSVSNPGNPGWNCCKARPAWVMRFDDGSAMVVCEPCSFHASRDRIHALPDGWRPGPDAD